MIERSRLDSENQGPGILFRACWHVSSLLLLLLLPVSLWFGEPLWEIPAEHIPSQLLISLAYLGGAWILERGGIWTSRAPAVGQAALYLGLAGLCYPAALLVLLLRPDLPYSRGVILLAGALGMGLLAFPVLFPKLRRFALPVVAGGAIVSFGWGVAEVGPPRAPAFGFEPGRERTFVRTNRHLLHLHYQREMVGPQEVRGGALARQGEGLVLATGNGELYRLEWEKDGPRMVATRLPLSVPLNREQFVEDVGMPEAGRFFRVADVYLDTDTSPTELYVSHHHWNERDQCFTMRVSRTSLSNTPSSRESWSTWFEAEPCLPMHDGFENAIQSGGRLTRLQDGPLLVTVGDHGFDGMDTPNLPQDPTSHFGKTVLIYKDGTAEVFTSGHRNPQGLALAEDGTIWVADQGPEGGDELNILEEGGNYGWPHVTYGTEYGMTSWPLYDPERHDEFEEPRFVWVPSPALSGLIVADSDLFPAWKGDLLASSLRDRSLYRIHLRGNEPVFAEPIEVGRRVRDLVVAGDGRLVLWTEVGDLVVIEPAEDARSGEALFAACAACHEGSEERAPTAPPLNGIIGREVAAVEGFPYSEALRQLEGAWDEPRLKAFLRQPQSVAPGTSMQYRVELTEAELEALLEYLEEY